MLMFVITACSSGGDNYPASNTNAASEKPVTTPAATNSAPKAKLNIKTASGDDLLATIPNFGNRMVHECEQPTARTWRASGGSSVGVERHLKVRSRDLNQLGIRSFRLTFLG